MEQMIPDSTTLCHNRSVSSFRDRFNPEAVHFPAQIRSKAMIVCGVLLSVLSTLPSYWVEQPLRPVIIDTAILFAVLAFLLSAWPSSLRTDQFGVSRDSPFPYRRVFIAWRDVASFETKVVYGGFLSSLGIYSEALIVYSTDGRKVVHGPRHPDRARFVHELELHGVATQSASGGEAESE